MDNGRSWTCTAYAYDIQFGNPAQNNSVTWKLAGTYPNTKIKGWKLTDTMSQNGDVAFGSTGSKAISLELLDLADKDFGTGAILGVVLGGAANGSWYFFVDNVEWTTNFGTTTTYSASVTAYDAMYYASNRISSVSLPTYYTNMINNGKASVDSCCEIAEYCIRHARYDLIRTRAAELYTETGEAKYDTYANMLDSAHDDTWTAGTKTMDDVVSNSVGKVNITPLSGYGSVNITLDKTVTGRGLLGRMAAMAGKRAYCDNGTIGNIGKIVFDNLLGISYNGGNSVNTKDVYDNGFVAEGKKNFKYFVSGTTNAPATYGKKTSNGYSTMAISCPDMDSSRLAHLSSSVANTEYELGKVKFRGDPALKAGMKVKFPDAGGTAHNTIATKVVSNYDGGFYQTVYSEGKSDSDIEFETNQAAEKATSTVENADSDAGGGGTNLLYYSEAESPDKAKIEVDSKSFEISSSGIAVEGSIAVDGDESIDGDLSVTGTFRVGTFASDHITTGGIGLPLNLSLQMWDLAFSQTGITWAQSTDSLGNTWIWCPELRGCIAPGGDFLIDLHQNGLSDDTGTCSGTTTLKVDVLETGTLSGISSLTGVGNITATNITATNGIFTNLSGISSLTVAGSGQKKTVIDGNVIYSYYNDNNYMVIQSTNSKAYIKWVKNGADMGVLSFDNTVLAFSPGGLPESGFNIDCANYRTWFGLYDYISGTSTHPGTYI